MTRDGGFGEQFQIVSCKVIQYVMDSGFQLLYSEFLVSGTNWIPDANRFRVSGFQSPGFQIPQENISCIPESVLHSHGAILTNNCNEGTVCLLTWKFELNNNKKRNNEKQNKKDNNGTKKMQVMSMTRKSKCYFKFVGNCDAHLSNRHGSTQWDSWTF